MIRLSLVLMLALSVEAWAQTGNQPAGPTEPGAGDSSNGARGADDASVTTRTDARTLTLTIPGLRGMITDRTGAPLATTRVGYQLGLSFKHFDDPKDEEIVSWARARLAQVERITDREYSSLLSDDRLISHYKERRWVPLVFSSLVEPEKIEEYRKVLPAGVVLHPVYHRYYPEKELAAHVLGYVRSKGKLPTGPIGHGELLFEDVYGQAGLEATLNDELIGEPGERKIIFDEGGEKLRDELSKRPRIGNTVVTTLNLAWQRHAETVLRESCERGAFVVLDIPTGEILVLASRPSYDINVWIPWISEEDLQALNQDEGDPMFGRAFQGQYPPASTFKPVVALTALTGNVVQEWSLINCPAKIKIGDKWFHNHVDYPEGNMNVARALARSNNCWFYQVGIETGPTAFLATARRLGFGSTTGLPLFGESPGRVPTMEYVREKFGRGFTDGDTANYSIGQAWEATPLQVAQAMAGIANGSVLPKLHLIKQVQDPTGGVLRAAEPEARQSLSFDPDAVQTVHEGMRDVVHAPYGTGQRGSLTFAEMAAKTGTAQWITGRELAWFAGFLPYENPRLAFVALYEGMPGEKVSGGRKAAPMVRNFFEPLKDEISDMIKPPSKALIVVEGGEGGEWTPGNLPTDEEGRLIIPDEGKIMKAIPVEPLDGDPNEELPPVQEETADPVPAEPADPGEREALPAIPVEEAPQAIPVPEPDDE